MRKPTGKRNDSKEVVEIGYLWNDASTDLVENLLKDGVAPKITLRVRSTSACIALPTS